MAMTDLNLAVNSMASSLASQLPQGMRLLTNIEYTLKHCGSWLASDEASTCQHKSHCPAATLAGACDGVTMLPRSICFHSGLAPNRALKR